MMIKTNGDSEEKPKVIFVDDDISVLEPVKRILSPYFEVEILSSANSAIEKIESNDQIAILIADLRMPEKNGLEILRHCKIISPTTVRVILSGQMDLRDMMVAVNQNEIDKFILKPWDNDYFLLQMQEALQTHLLLSERTQLQHLAVTDTVTGLKNHRYFQENLKSEIERCNRHRRPLSLVMIDIDYFKKFNDSHGHVEGDKVLALVATALEKEVRTVDTVARYGGEEFAVILPETEIDQAFEVCERLREAVSKETMNRNQPLTISLGVTQHQFGETPESLITRADMALYQSKKKGRNVTSKN